jgi:hypothetical protein
MRPDGIVAHAEPAARYVKIKPPHEAKDAVGSLSRTQSWLRKREPDRLRILTRIPILSSPGWKPALENAVSSQGTLGTAFGRVLSKYKTRGATHQLRASRLSTTLGP